MIQSFYQTRTVTDDTMTAQIPNPSRTAHACTHEEFIKTGVTPSSVTQRKWTMTDLTHLTDYFQKDSCGHACTCTREKFTCYCVKSVKSVKCHKRGVDTVQRETGNSNRGTEGFWKSFAYVRLYVRVIFLIFYCSSVPLFLWT